MRYLFAANIILFFYSYFVTIQRKGMAGYQASNKA